MGYKITSQKGYEEIKARVEKGAKFLEGKWSDPKYSREVRHYESMASAMLDWEMFHSDIFDKAFAKFEKELEERKSSKSRA